MIGWKGTAKGEGDQSDQAPISRTTRDEGQLGV
jgi:hypothetical protein